MLGNFFHIRLVVLRTPINAPMILILIEMKSQYNLSPLPPKKRKKIFKKYIKRRKRNKPYINSSSNQQWHNFPSYHLTRFTRKGTSAKKKITFPFPRIFSLSLRPEFPFPTETFFQSCRCSMTLAGSFASYPSGKEEGSVYSLPLWRRSFSRLWNLSPPIIPSILPAYPLPLLKIIIKK